MDDVTLMGIDEVGGLLRRGKISPSELVEESLGKIEAWREKTNAFITVTADLARAAAKDAERRLAKGDPNPLCGIPVALKDIYCTKGILTSAGSGMMADFIPEYDSTIAARLAGAGSILMGKANTHEWACGSTGDESFYGPARNPRDPGRVTGGSSSGSAAAVAVGMAFAGMGSDTGGSIRTPAALCGVVGFKPTRGLASLHGVLPLSPSLDHTGPLTRSVMDAALVMDAITGFDPDDPCPARHRGGPTSFAAGILGMDSLRGTTIGIPGPFFFEKADYGVEKSFREAVLALERLGAKIVDVSTPHMEKLTEASSLIVTVEAAWVHRNRMAANPGGFNATMRARLERGAACSVIEYIDALNVQNEIRGSWERTMAAVDAVVAPTVPATACPVMDREILVRGRKEPVLPLYSRHTRFSNATGGPALSVPCGLAENGLPAGIMFMGKAGDDLGTLRMGYAYEKHNPFLFPRRES